MLTLDFASTCIDQALVVAFGLTHNLYWQKDLVVYGEATCHHQCASRAKQKHYMTVQGTNECWIHRDQKLFTAFIHHYKVLLGWQHC